MSLTRIMIVSTAAFLTSALAFVGVVGASAPHVEMPPNAIAYTYVEYERPDIDVEYSEFDRLLDEMSPSYECSGGSCAVGCWWGCCAITCPAGTTPDCYCSWGSPHCVCNPTEVNVAVQNTP